MLMCKLIYMHIKFNPLTQAEYILMRMSRATICC